MFLSWVGQLGLLAHSPDTGVIRDFPLHIRKVLVSQVVNYLLDETTPRHMLSSHRHVTWAMECIGQAFALPIEESAIIQNAIDLYWRWLTLPKARPVPISEDEQFFIQQIFKHYSMLFEARPGQSASQARQMEMRQVTLCKKIIEIFEVLGRIHSDNYSEETWSVLLNICIGTTDYLSRARLISETLPSELLPSLLRVDCELLVRSKSMDPRMWAEWIQLYQQWGHRLPAIYQWNTMCMSLTRNVAYLIYGPSEGNAYITCESSKSSKSRLSVESEHLFFLWHHFLNITGNLNALSDPVIYRHAMTGISDLSDFLLGIDGNLCIDTILSILGKWLFEAVLLDKPSHEEGRAVAIGALCRVFGHRGGKAPSIDNIGRFYSSLLSVLKNHGLGRMKCAVITNCEGLFTTGLDGVLSLVGTFVDICRDIIATSAPEWMISVPIPALRKSAITILGSFACLGSQFMSKDVEKKEEVVVEEEEEEEEEVVVEEEVEVIVEEEVEEVQVQPEIPQDTWLDEELSGLLGTAPVGLPASPAPPAHVEPVNIGSLETRMSRTMSRKMREVVIDPNEPPVPAPAPQEKPSTPPPTTRAKRGSTKKVTVHRTRAAAVAKPRSKTSDFQDLNEDLITLLLTGLHFELDHCNARQMLWLLYLLVTDLDKPTAAGKSLSMPHSKMVWKVANIILHFFSPEGFELAHTPTDVMVCGLSVLSSLTGLDVVKIPGSLSPPSDLSENLLSYTREKCKTTTIKLCSFVSSLLFSPPSFLKTSEREEIVVNAYGCLVECLMNLPYLQRDYESLNSVFKIIQGSLSEKRKVPSGIRSAAQSALLYLLHETFHFPSPIGPQCTGSLLQEIDVVPDAGNLADSGAVGSHFARYFILNDSIIVSLVEQPRPRNPYVTAFFRSIVGRSSWELRSLWVPYTSEPPLDIDRTVNPFLGGSDQEEKSVVPKPTPNDPSVDPAEQSDVASDCQFVHSTAPILLTETARGKGRGGGNPEDHLDETLKAKHQTFLRALLSQAKSESSVLSGRRKFDYDTSVSPHCKTNPYGGPCGIQEVRKFLVQLGLLQLENRTQFRVLHQTTRLDRSLNLLDRLGVRECHTVSVLYAAKGQTSLPEMLLNTEGSDHFNEFLYGLGWMVNLKQHEGFLGRLDREDCGPKSPYYANHACEIMFHVPTLLPSGTAKAESMRTQLVQIDTVHIVWNDNNKPYKPSKEAEGSVLLTIVINTLANRLYSIELFDYSSKSDMKSVGPLYDSSILRWGCLASLVRKTCMNACRLASTQVPTDIRNEHLSTIAQKYVKSMKAPKFHSLLYMSDPLQVSPEMTMKQPRDPPIRDSMNLFDREQRDVRPTTTAFATTPIPDSVPTSSYLASTDNTTDKLSVSAPSSGRSLSVPPKK